MRSFWDFVDTLVANSEITIDRPRGSQHPRYPDRVYPYDYGYLKGTTAVDGGGIDVWIGSKLDRRPTALIITVDLGKRDSEVKILLGCTVNEQQDILDFHNGHNMRAMLVPRGGETMSWLLSRRSVRRFRDEPVSQEVVERLLTAATWAPSAHNRQPWRFAVITSSEAKERLGRTMGDELRRDLLADGVSETEAECQVWRSQQRIMAAPVVILVCYSAENMDIYHDERRRQAEYLMGVQSVAMAGENLMLAAQTQGLGGVWVCAPLFAPQAASRSLELPKDWEPQGMILLGYPEKMPAARKRLDLDAVSRYY